MNGRQEPADGTQPFAFYEGYLDELSIFSGALDETELKDYIKGDIDVSLNSTVRVECGQEGWIPIYMNKHLYFLPPGRAFLSFLNDKS